MTDIFISYARSTTAAHAQALAEGLRALGYAVWYDEALPAHRDFGDVIAEHLLTAKAVVVIWSDEAVKSQWVRSEANRAREAHKLVMLRIDDAQLPMPFDQIHCVDMRGWNGDIAIAGWKKIVASVADLTGGLRDIASAEFKGVSTARKTSICVLPFVNMSDDPEQEYFSDGISEDIITDLSKVSALSVIARNSSFTFKGKNVDVRQIARELNVGHVLEGSVRRVSGRVRISAQLIDGVHNDHIWAERYDRDLNDIFALQEEIAQAIVSALKLRLLPEEKQSIERRGTHSVEAYDLFLRGTRPAFTHDEMRARIALLEAATKLAPDYADAWGALALARSFLRYERPYAERDEIAKLVSDEAQRALAINDHTVAALLAQFHLLPPFGQIDDAEALTSRLGEIGRGNTQFLGRYARYLRSLGRASQALDVAQQAYQIDPLDPMTLNLRAQMLAHVGRYAEARRGYEDLLVRWPNYQGAVSNLLLLCIHAEDWATVDALLAPERLAQYSSKQFERRDLGYVAVIRDPSPQSRRRPIEAARKRFETSGVADFNQLQMAVAADRNALDEAYAIALSARFGPAGNSRDLIGYNAYRPSYLFHSMYPDFRRDARFVKLCARLGLVDYWLTTQKWPDCVDEVAPYYDFKVECERVAAGPPLPPANEAGSHS